MSRISKVLVFLALLGAPLVLAQQQQGELGEEKEGQKVWDRRNKGDKKKKSPRVVKKGESGARGKRAGERAARSTLSRSEPFLLSRAASSFAAASRLGEDVQSLARADGERRKLKK